MKKYISILVLLIIIIPSVASAVWWNPFSWNWRALFSESKIETLSRDQQGKDALSEISTIKKITTSSEVEKTKLPTELNISNTIADYYQSTINTTDKGLDILALISSESNRYINNIPGNFLNLKSMVNIGFNTNVATEINKLLDELSNSYISDFRKLKNNVDIYATELKKQQSLLSKVSQNIRGKHVSVNESATYTNEIDQYWNNINQQINAFQISLDNLSTEYLKDKKVLGEGIYQGSMGNIQDQLKSFETISTYRPTVFNVSIYTPPIRTYCSSFGDNFNCTSYQ